MDSSKRSALSAFTFLLLTGISYQSNAVIGGSLADATSSPTLQLAVASAADAPDSTGIGSCGGVLIAPNLLLTAAHCVYPQLDPSINNIALRQGQVLKNGFGYKVFIHPDMMNKIKFQQLGHIPAGCDAPDLALVNFSNNVGFKTAQIDSRNLLSRGMPLLVFGYGRQSHDQVSVLRNNLRELNSEVLSLEGTCLYTNSKEGAVAPGDSGSPAYLRYSNGTQAVVGVASWGRDPLIFGLGGAQAFSRVDDEMPATVRMSTWINSVQTGKIHPSYSLPK